MKWETAKLGDYIDIQSGYAFKSNDFTNRGIPVIKIKNITPPSVSLDDLSFVPNEVAELTQKFLLNYNDVLIALTGSHINQMASVVGRVARVKYNQPSMLNQRVARITVKDSTECDIDYVYYYLSQDEIKIKLASNAGGAANQANISPSDVKNLIIPFPKYKRQKAISSILSAYDDLIENNQKQIKLLEEAAQRLYKEWFVDFRFPGHETTTIIDGVPEGWTEKRFYELFSFVRGKSYTSKELSDADGILMVNLKSIRPFGGFRRNQEKHYIGKYNADQILEPGDIVMGVTDMTKERRLVGHVALVPDLQEKATFSMDLIKITPFSLPKSYLYSVLHFGGLSAQISQLANGVNVLHLKPEAMKNKSMLCPTEKIISDYDKLFETIQYRIEVLQKECDFAVETRDRLLPKLMSGEIEV